MLHQGIQSTNSWKQFAHHHQTGAKHSGLKKQLASPRHLGKRVCQDRLPMEFDGVRKFSELDLFSGFSWEDSTSLQWKQKKIASPAL